MSIVAMLYLADFVYNLSTVLVIFAAVGIAYFGISTIDNATRGINPISPNGKKAAILAAISFGLCTFIPSKKTMYMMAAASYTQELAATPKVTEIGDKVYKLLNEKLDEALEKKK